MRKILIFIFLLSSTVTFAGLNGMTHHSRANCVNNESISWNALAPEKTSVISEHYNAKTGAFIHNIITGWKMRRRNAAVHYGEGNGEWYVVGYHSVVTKLDQGYVAAVEQIYDCDIYDGWWEFDDKDDGENK